MPHAYVTTVAERLMQQMTEGVAPWMRPQAPGKRFLPYNPISGRSYCGMNAIWLAAIAQARGYDDTRWLTLRQMNERGGEVRKGETGSAVQFWTWHDAIPLRGDDGMPLLDADGRPRKRFARLEQPRLFNAMVFNARQASGLAAAPERPVFAEAERLGIMGALVRNAGVGIVHGWQRQTSYSPAQDAITIPAELVEGDAYNAALIRGLAVATGHAKRLDRDQSHPIGSEAHARERLRVEIAAMLLGDRLGTGHAPVSDVDYMKKWLRLIVNDPLEAFRATADADAIVQFLCGLERRLGQGHVMLREDGVKEDAVVTRGKPNGGQNDPIYLAVPYAERREASALGADWDKVAKLWFVPPGVNPEPLVARWGRDKAITLAANPVDEFAEALKAMGFLLKGAPIMDGRMHRAPVEGDKHGQKSGAYAGHLDGFPGGYIKNHKTGAERNWKSSQRVTALSAADRTRLLEESAVRRTERERELEAIHEQTIRAVGRHIEGSPAAPADHPYLARKQIHSDHGAFVDIAGPLPLAGGQVDVQHWSAKDNLIVPICDLDGNLLSAQSIAADGRKSFPRGARWQGGMHLIGELTASETIVIVEGFATGATIREASAWPVAVAFHAGNLVHVAELVHASHPEARIIVAGDNDHHRPFETGPDGRPKINVGRIEAEKAAEAVGGFVLLPQFERGDTGTDWNDLAVDKGIAVFSEQWHAGLARAERVCLAADLAKARAEPRETGAELQMTQGR